MKRIVFLASMFLALTLLATGPAQATCTCSGVPNCLGVYFDQGTWTQTCLDPPLFAPFHMYFVLQNVEFDAIGGLQFGWRFDPAPGTWPIILLMDFPWDVVNMGTNTNILLANLGWIPITTQPMVVDVTLLNVSSYVANIMLGPPVPAEIPGHAAISDYHQPTHFVPINFPCPVGPDGWTIEGVARIGECVVANEATVWGTVKALYR